MKIYLVDIQKHINITFEEAKAILASGLEPSEWTRQSVQPYLMH